PHAAPAQLDDLGRRSESGALHSRLAARGKWLWLGTGASLYLYDGARFVPAQLADHRPQLLAASSTGDAWLATERGLVRSPPRSPYGYIKARRSRRATDDRDRRRSSHRRRSRRRGSCTATTPAIAPRPRPRPS